MTIRATAFRDVRLSDLQSGIIFTLDYEVDGARHSVELHASSQFAIPERVRIYLEHRHAELVAVS